MNQSPTPTTAPAELDQLVDELLARMTLREKAKLLSGLDTWHTVPNQRLGITSLTMTDGPHGVRAQREGGRKSGPATSFPTGVSMGACWNPALIREVGVALADETRAMECDVLLGPCVNIIRHPLAGRNFESLAEDPYLAGTIATAYVQGVQSRGVGTSLKHYACNNQETERMRGNSLVDERTLREIYLAQFEMVVKQARPWTVMCAYNRINGVYASEHDYLLNQILRREWGFEGAVISDWGANHTTVESLKGGLDLEMPGPAKYYGQLIVDAVYTWQLEEETVTQAARRMLRLLGQAGRLPGQTPPDVAEGAVNTPDHQHLARRLAEEAMVLLKNERHVLPLKPQELRSLAVIGPNAAVASIGGGGSSFVDPPYAISPLEGLRARLGGELNIIYELGCDNTYEVPIISNDYLHTPSGMPGMHGRYWDNPTFAGEPLLERVDDKMEFWWFSFHPHPTPNEFAVRWQTTLTVPESGSYTLKVQNTGVSRAYLDGALVLENDLSRPVGLPFGPAQTRLELEGGRAYELTLEYVRVEDTDFAHIKVMLGKDIDVEASIARAVEVARAADVALVFVGYPVGYESEGWDRPTMRLTGQQDRLIEEIARANPNTVVVLHSGIPIEMPWLESVPALLEAFYSGQEGGGAITSLLLGETNPSGKLPITFPRRLEDTPAYPNFPGGREVRYGEGIFVGYRYYDLKAVEPLFPFGFGLSYTSFGYENLQLPHEARVGETVTATVTVTNTGAVAGSEVVQLYVHDQQSSLARPPKELKGFAKVELKPGESRTVSFELDERAFAFYDPDRKGWVVEPGAFDILIGSSSRDIRAQATLQIVPGYPVAAA